MGKTYQALLRAGKEQKRDLLVPQRVPENALLPALSPVEGIREVPEWFRDLKTRLQTQGSKKDCKSIMFTGINNKCGCTSTVAGFGGTLANSYGHRVLLLDFNFRSPGLQQFFRPDSHDINDIFNKMGGLSFPANGFQGNLCVVTCNGNGNSKEMDDALSLIASPKFSDLMDEMKFIFDFILVDTTPITMCPESRQIASKVDGVVLVLEPGKSRIQIAERAKMEIESAGGQLLGVILNRRKFYIPKWLYRML
jgi:Mrp family chromosome partitioning ATPase